MWNGTGMDCWQLCTHNALWVDRIGMIPSDVHLRNAHTQKIGRQKIRQEHQMRQVYSFYLRVRFRVCALETTRRLLLPPRLLAYVPNACVFRILGPII
jgi:hypothetical protein